MTVSIWCGLTAPSPTIRTFLYHRLMGFTSETATTKTSGLGRPSRLADPGFVDLLATMLINGQTREQICKELNVGDAGTVSKWKKDPRVKAAADKLIKDRILVITARTDAAIMRRLENADEMTVKEILEVRKEFLGGKMRDRTEDIDEETVNEMQDWLSENPDDADALEKMLSGAASNPSSAE